MKFLLVLLSVLALLTGCASTPYYHYHSNPHLPYNSHYKVIPVYMDRHFSPEEIVVITTVIAEWNYVLNGQMKIAIAKGTFDHNDEAHVKVIADRLSNTTEGFMLIGVNHDDKMIASYMAKEVPGGKMLAFCDQIGDDKVSGLYVIRDRIGMRNLHQILLHEFGHALGSDHTNAYSLMYPRYGAGEPDCIDKITAAQVAGYQGISLPAMNYCAIPSFE